MILPDDSLQNDKESNKASPKTQSNNQIIESYWELSMIKII